MMSGEDSENQLALVKELQLSMMMDKGLVP
jgi:hypothetical protein